jgi:exosortase E/protease (VPEID-CTERM system)
VRWSVLVALLAGEAIALSVRFDTESLGDTPSGWAAFLAIMPQLARLAVVVAVVALLSCIRALVRDRSLHAAEIAARGRWRWSSWLAAHVAALAAFFYETSAVIENGRASGNHASYWVLAWAATAFVCIGSWGLCLLPPRFWWQTKTAMARGLTVGAAAGLIVWAASLWAERLWLPLADGTLRCVHRLLTLIYADVTCQADDFIIGTPAFQVHIAPGCSGYEGMGLIVAFLSAYLWIERGRLRFPHALVLLPLGAAAAWAANVLRIFALVIMGSSWSRSIAIGGFHSQAGWLTFIALALALVAAAGRLRFFEAADVQRAESGHNPAAAYLVPFLAAVATGILTAAFSDGFDLLYPLRVLAAAGALWWFRGRYREVRWSGSWHAVAAGAAVAGAWVLMAPPGDESSPAAELARWPAAVAMFWWASRIIGYLLVTPLVEELAFRGFLMRRLTSADFESVPLGRATPLAFVASSLAFGIEHGSFWLVGTLAGMAYALALSRRGSLGDALVAHATTNALLASYVLLTGHWSLWS